MDGRIAETRAATIAEWDRFFEACPWATYFHSREWAEAWQESSGGALVPDPRLVTFTDGSQALLPLTVRRLFRGLACQTLSSPADTYGGWLALEPLSEDRALSLALWLIRRGDVAWRLNPFDGATSSLVSRLATFREVHVVPDETHCLDLCGGLPTPTKTWRWSTGHAGRARVTTRVANGEADWRAWGAVYADCLQRWGARASSRYDWSLFAALSRRPGVTLRLAEHEGRTVAGLVSVHAPSHVAVWLAGTMTGSVRTRACDVLYDDALRAAVSNGVRWFDLNPSGRLAGVIRFKRGFGAALRPAPFVLVPSPLHRWLERMAILTRRLVGGARP